MIDGQSLLTDIVTKSTASHTLKVRRLPAGVQVRLGELHRRSESEPGRHEDRGVRRALPHPRYSNLTQEWDIALLELNSTVELQVRPASSCGDLT